MNLKLKIYISNHVKVEEDLLNMLSLTLINTDNRPCSSVYLLPRNIECRADRVIFLPFGFIMEEDQGYLVFKRGPTKFSLPKNFVHYIEDTLTYQVLWHEHA
ncbi:hypothetical protein L6259_00935 [Candidatus Parcubacteria bacterium]|nr:hypothetical protein [Patescibacteria group bacterium]MCG2693838.1 hypothetical protein [Candidatus Parcubacteria bacterium]